MLSNLQLTSFFYGVLFACEIFGFPLASVIPVFAAVKSRPISIAYRGFVVLLTLVFIARALRQRWLVLQGPVAVAAGALAVLLLARMVWDATFDVLPLNLPWSDQFQFLFGVTVIPTLAFVMVPPQEALAMSRKIGVWVGCVTIFFVIAAVAFTLRNGIARANLGGRLQTDVLNPISLAQMATSCLILVNARMIAGTEQRRWFKTGARWLMSLICVLLVLASISKGPILAMFAVILVAGLFRGRIDLSGGGLIARIFFLIVALAAAFGILLLLDTYTPIQIISRFANAGADASTSTRLDLIKGAISQFEESPLFGSAVVEYNSMFYPHNIIVEVMMTNGILGLTALLGLLFGCLYHTSRILLSMPNERWIALMFVQYFIVAMFSGSLYYDASTWATMLIVLACARAEPTNLGLALPQTPQ